jgi:hypothetical protein
MNERSKRRKKISEKWVAEGKCPNCGARPPAPRRKQCEKCLNISLRTTRRARIRNPDAFRNQYNARKEAGLCVNCGVPGKLRTNGLWCKGCSTTERQRTVRIKNDVMQRYGGECFCCGEGRVAFLTLDHMNDDGARRRKYGEGGGGQLYKRLLREALDPTLRVACYNCNCGRRSTGVCPHKDNAYFEEALARERWDRRSTLKSPGEQLRLPGL